MKKKNLEHTFEDAFQQGKETLPEDRYFSKIWNSIENKAPVGEKYYLRFLFTLFFFFLFIVVFILFYSDFLSSVLTLKQIRRENTAYHASTPHPYIPPAQGAKNATGKEIAAGITMREVNKTTIGNLKTSQNQVSLDFLQGHAVIENTGKVNSLKLHLPDLEVSVPLGNLNLFCYDQIIRIIPLSHTIYVTRNQETYTLNPGQTFYLLNKKPVIH